MECGQAGRLIQGEWLRRLLHARGVCQGEEAILLEVMNGSERTTSRRVVSDTAWVARIADSGIRVNRRSDGAVPVGLRWSTDALCRAKETGSWLTNAAQ